MAKGVKVESIAMAQIHPSTVKGSDAWLKASTNLLRMMLENREAECAKVAEHVAELRAVLDGRGIDWTSYCEDELGKPTAFVDLLIEAVAIAKSRGHKTITHEEALAMVDADEAGLPKRGRPSKERKDNNIIFSDKQGTDLTYTLRRLKRDAPKLFEQVRAGELSANAAALKAGFRKPTRSIPIDSPESAVRALLRVFTKENLKQALEEL